MSFARYQPNTSALFSGTLIDEAGVAVPLANINTFTLTLVDGMTGSTVNGRNAQNALNANNVTVNSTTGAVNWSVQVGDLTPASLLTTYREHVATFVCTYSTSKVIRFQHRMRIVTALTLCALEDIETYLGVIEESEQPFIEMLIEQISARAETECDRKFLRVVDKVEYFSPDGRDTRLRVKHYPIESVSEIIEEASGTWTSGYVYPATDYGIDNDNGIIRTRFSTAYAGRQSVRITYTGGLARDCSGIPMDLRFACTRQVVFGYQRRKSLGVGAISVARGGKEVFDLSEHDLLSDVQRVFDLYRSLY